jgi:hypothetical protein
MTSEKRTRELERAFQEHVPEYKVVYKNNDGSWWSDAWMVRCVQLVIMVIGWFNPRFEKHFHRRIANGMGPYLLLPDRPKYRQWDREDVYGIIRHELVHMRDFHRHRVLFPLTYLLFPFPIGCSGRAWWEIRGYTQQMIVEYERRGKISDMTVTWIKRQLFGSLYLWPLLWPFRRLGERKIDEIRKAIEREDIEGMYPSLSLFGDARPSEE